MQAIKFQEENVKALLGMFDKQNRVLLADETGLGKTVTTALLMAGMAIQKHKKNKKGKFNVLYICSNERIARKNMGELCSDLSDDETIKRAANLLNLNYPGILVDPRDAKKMASKRGARLSMDLVEYDESFVQIYNSTPDTSFRISNSIKVGGTKEEYEQLMKKKKPGNDVGLSEDEYKAFADRRKEAVKKNFDERKFDLIILDEYQSYEDILPIGSRSDKNCQGKSDELKVQTTVEDLLKGNNTRVLMLSATPYQSKTDESNKFRDFRDVLFFLSSGEENDLVKSFGEYCEALYNEKCPFDELVRKKDLFEKELQKYCRRNQRTDALRSGEKPLFSKPECKRQVEYKAALKYEMITRKESLEIKNDINTATCDEEELSASVLEIQMERDTAWGYSFSKDYKYRCNGERSKEFFNTVAKKSNLMITMGKRISEENDSKRCKQSIMDSCTKESEGNDNSKGKTIECKRFLNSGEPVELCSSKEWPNFKIQAIRDISTETTIEESGYPDLYNCIWLPASAPDYEPDQKSPYHKFYKKSPSKTIVFSRYKMTTRSIAALISIEAAKCGGKLNISNDDWDWLKVSPGETIDEKIKNGHPFCCAYNALKSKVERDDYREHYAMQIAEELVDYFKRDEIQAVLFRTGVRNIDDLMGYCRNGNLTAILREYLSLKRINYSVNGILLYASKKTSDWKRLDAADKLRRVYELAWQEMKAADPDAILQGVLNNGFKPEYVDDNKEPYDGLINGKPDGFEMARVAAWKTWFAYQLLHGDKRDKICEKIKEAIGKAIERVLEKGEITQKSFNYSWCRAYKGYKVNGKDIDAHTIESYIMKTKGYAEQLTFDGKNGFPSRYMMHPDPNIKKRTISEADFLKEGIDKRVEEKKKDCRKSNLCFDRNHETVKAWNTELFNRFGVTHDIWDDVDDKQNDRILDFMPEMHVCADFKTDNRIECGRIPLGFAARYTNEIQDSNDHNDNGAEEIMDAFNSPFYPFVLAVTDTAKEGLNFHAYCRRLIHLNIPDRPAVLIQREGRIDRFRSLVLRQRLANMPDFKEWENWENAWIRVVEKDVLNAEDNGMIPNWYIESEGGPNIEKYYLLNEGTDDRIKVGNIERDAELYKRMLGSFLEEELSKNLSRRYPNDKIEKLKLNLVP